MKEEEKRKKLIMKVKSIDWDSLILAAPLHVFFLWVSGCIFGIFMVAMIVLLVQGMQLDAAFNLCKGIFHNTAGDVFPGFLSIWWMISLVLMILEEVFCADCICTIIRVYFFALKRRIKKRIRRWFKK